MESLHWGSDTLLLLLIAALGWMVRMSMISNNKKHEVHFQHSDNRQIHESIEERRAAEKGVSSRIEAHERLDDERFKVVDEIKQDIKDILKILGARQ